MTTLSRANVSKVDPECAHALVTVSVHVSAPDKAMSADDTVDNSDHRDDVRQ